MVPEADSRSQIMGFWTKLQLLLYLTAWSTFVAWVSVHLIFVMNPGLAVGSLLPFFPTIAPIFAAPISLRVNFSLLHKRKYLTAKDLLLYTFLAPVVLYLCMLTFYSLLTLIWFPITFVTGFVLGIPALALGMIIHALGLAPLWLVRRRIFTEPHVVRS